jgi:hypothetical protein
MKKVLLFLLLSLIVGVSVVHADSRALVRFEWSPSDGADAGYRFFIKNVDTGMLIKVGEAPAGSTNTEISLTALRGSKFTVHVTGVSLLGFESDLSEPATIGDTGVIGYLVQPGNSALKIRYAPVPSTK